MIFEYEELKDYVNEDFERFCQMGFNEKQIYLAVLNEYEHGEDFGQVENICIHVFIALTYKERKWNCDEIVSKIKQMLSDGFEKNVKEELKNEYSKFVIDLEYVM